MSKEEIKKEKFKAVPEGATTKQHDFEGEYKKSDQRLVKNEDGKYIIIEKSELVPGTLKRKGDKEENSGEFNDNDRERKIKEDEKLCNFVCENCDKLKMGQCGEESIVCDTCDGKAEVIYYRKKIEKGDMVFRKPFSVKKKQ